MKLPTQTHGPVTLSKIDYAANLSQETYAFTATISIVVDGKTLTSGVSNEGTGGPNNIYDRAVESAVEAYAKTLPPEPSEYSDEPEPWAITADYLISIMVGDAIDTHEVKKVLSKKVLFLKPDGKVYGIPVKQHPVAAVIAHVEKNVVGARVLNTMPFPEAVALYKAAVAS